MSSNCPQALSWTRVSPWSSARLIAQGRESDFADGMHAGEATVAYYVQVTQLMQCTVPICRSFLLY